MLCKFFLLVTTQLWHQFSSYASFLPSLHFFFFICSWFVCTSYIVSMHCSLPFFPVIWYCVNTGATRIYFDTYNFFHYVLSFLHYISEEIDFLFSLCLKPLSLLPSELGAGHYRSRRFCVKVSRFRIRVYAFCSLFTRNNYGLLT